MFFSQNVEYFLPHISISVIFESYMYIQIFNVIFMFIKVQMSLRQLTMVPLLVPLSLVYVAALVVEVVGVVEVVAVAVVVVVVLDLILLLCLTSPMMTQMLAIPPLHSPLLVCLVSTLADHSFEML